MMQEVPKQADRVPSKCVYVWACDMNRITTMVLFQCYKAQANLSARVAVERKAYKLLRAKQVCKFVYPCRRVCVRVRGRARGACAQATRECVQKMPVASCDT